MGEVGEMKMASRSQPCGTGPADQIGPRGLRILDLFSCVGCHALGMHRAGHQTVALCESNAWRRAQLAANFPGVPIHDDVRTIAPPAADVCFGGPPCQQTSVAAAIHGYRSGASLWRDMLRAGLDAGCEWFVVEQPPGNKAWEAEVCGDLSQAGRHTARFEFAASDVRAPYPRRRVYILSSPSLSRLEVAWKAGPSAIERVARAADARADWDTRQLEALRVDAWSAGEMDRGRSAERKQRIEALGDSNPPGMAEVIGLMLAAASMTNAAAPAAHAAQVEGEGSREEPSSSLSTEGEANAG